MIIKQHHLKSCSTLVHNEVLEFKLYDFMTEQGNNNKEQGTSIKTFLRKVSKFPSEQAFWHEKINCNKARDKL